ncbi:beta-ketoacyl synthase N-terminal-like domain-containing protein [Actinosynnema sp. NPDC020468]|uniref:beta-ketoacyl synthase N-terminal-like domain-containing protein n=1 Tax=Actinosynnema sp. NPDC020468 TaxID=3154488 RepID=UPI0033C4F34A
MTVITGWSAVSAHGRGRAAFLAGLGSTPADPLVPDVPATPGQGGVRLDRASLLALAALEELVADVDTGDRAGLVLGTTSGSLHTEMEHMRSSLTEKRPHHLDPKTIPSGTMNCAAAQCAMRYGVTGPNTTLAGGTGAALHALGYAARLLVADRADTVLVGAVEESTPSRTAVEHAAHGVRPLGEGGAVVRLERAGGPRPVLAEVLATHGVLGPPETCATALLRRAGLDRSDVWAVLGPVEGFPDAVTRRLPEPGLGDTGAASGAFALATALGRGEPGEHVLVLAHDADGTTAGALLRLADSTGEAQ